MQGGQTERGATEPGKVEQWRARWRKTGQGSVVLERTGQGKQRKLSAAEEQKLAEIWVGKKWASVRNAG